MPDTTAGFHTIDECLADVRAGRMIVLVDDEHRENEGDLVVPAEKATPEAINFMMRNACGHSLPGHVAGHLRSAAPRPDAGRQCRSASDAVHAVDRCPERHHDGDLGLRPGPHRAVAIDDRPRPTI